MKKTVRRPDGAEETVEGTAEEIAEYERRIRGETNEGKKKPPVLKGKELEDEVLRLVSAELYRRQYQATVDWQKFFQDFKWPSSEIACWYCGVIGCRTAHPWYDGTTITTSGLLKG